MRHRTEIGFVAAIFVVGLGLATCGILAESLPFVGAGTLLMTWDAAVGLCLASNMARDGR